VKVERYRDVEKQLKKLEKVKGQREEKK